MLNQLLKLERPLIVLDAETTGTDPQRDRMIELGFQIWKAEGLHAEWRSYINPGVSIPQESINVHHITDSMIAGCRSCGRLAIEHPSDLCQAFQPVPRFAQIAPKLAAGFSGCDFAGKHVLFDLRFLAAEFLRAKVAWSVIGARIIDADRLEQLGDPRSLTHLVKKHLGEDMTADAHSALGDVQWTSKLIAAQFESYGGLPRDLNKLHALQFPGMIDLDGKFKFDKHGVPRFGTWGKHAGKPMNDPDVGKPGRDGTSYWDFILAGDFSAEVKALAGAAKLGKYPEVTR